MTKVIVVFKLLLFISKWERPTWPPSIQMEVTAGIFLASILLKEMRYLVYIRYLCPTPTDHHPHPQHHRPPPFKLKYTLNPNPH
jgi:hypothetical protein